jgi:hypothetical protein
MHVLPKGFMKIRHFGLLASRQREGRLREARKLLLATLPASAIAGSIGPAESPRCSACGSVRLARGELVPPVPLSPFTCGAGRASASVPLLDTS